MPGAGASRPVADPAPRIWLVSPRTHLQDDALHKRGHRSSLANLVSRGTTKPSSSSPWRLRCYKPPRPEELTDRRDKAATRRGGTGSAEGASGGAPTSVASVPRCSASLLNPVGKDTVGGDQLDGFCPPPRPKQNKFASLAGNRFVQHNEGRLAGTSRVSAGALAAAGLRR